VDDATELKKLDPVLTKPMPNFTNTALRHLLALFTTLGCQPIHTRASEPVRNADLAIIEAELLDTNGNSPTSDDTPLYNKGGPPGVCDSLPPILAPDSHQVTLGEWRQASGTSSVKCIQSGTHVVIHLSGLIPKGVYSVDVVTFKAPGFDGTFENVIGVGALGPNDGSQNTFIASASGEGQISVIHPSGPLSLFGEVASCLQDEFEFQLVGVYHLDGMSHGPTPGPSCGFVDAFAWDFRP